MKFYFISMLFFFSTHSFARGFTLGAQFLTQSLHYKEPGIMHEKGRLSGFGVDLRYDFNSLFYVNAHGRFLTGNLKYVGSTFDGDPISVTTNDYVTEYRGTFHLNLGPLAPYAGIGRRYWRNDLVISYVRDTTYLYTPIGLRLYLRPFYVLAERRIFLSGLNESFMSDVDSNRRDVKLKQESGKGYALETGYVGRLWRLSYKLSLAYEHWWVADSKIAFDGVDTLIEPKNSTNILVLGFGVYY